MRHLAKILAMLVIILISLMAARPVLAFPPLPSSFYGTIKVNGTNVPDGTLVQASINGKIVNETQTTTYQGDSAYSMDILGDDPATADVEGGKDGDTIVFTIGGTAADQTGTWKSGTNINLDITVSSEATLIPPQDTPTPTSTQTPFVIVISPTFTKTTQAQPTPMATQTPIIVGTPTTATSTTQAQATPMPTQTTIIVGTPATATPTTQVQATPTTGVRSQTSPPPTTQNQNTQAIPTETNQENSSSDFNPIVVVVVILFAVLILLSTYWLIKARKPKTK